MFFAACFSGFSIGAIFGEIEPILGSLPSLASGNTFSVQDNNLFMYCRSFVLNIFSQPSLEKNCLYLCSPSFAVVLVLIEPQ